MDRGKRKIGLTTVLLTLYCIPTIYLVGNTVMASVKTRSDLAQSFFSLPSEITFDNFFLVLIEDGFIRYFFNSVMLTSMSLVSLVVVSAMLAYGISWYKFKFNSAFEVFFLFGLMFPIQLGILPNFVTLRTLGLLNNLFGLVLIYTANLSLSCFIFSKFFKTLPIELYEAAKIDGAGEFRIFFKIMLPLSKPVIGTVALISGVNIWNDFYMPMVFLTRDPVKTMTLGVYRYMSNFMANWDKIFPAVTVVLIPIIILFVLTSKQLIGGLTSGAIKQ